MNNKYNYKEDKEYLEYLEREKREAHLTIYDDANNNHSEVKCPICKKNELLEEGANAISRKDNETEICSDCGRKEAMEELENMVGIVKNKDGSFEIDPTLL